MHTFGYSKWKIFIFSCFSQLISCPRLCCVLLLTVAVHTWLFGSMRSATFITYETHEKCQMPLNTVQVSPRKHNTCRHPHYFLIHPTTHGRLRAMGTADGRSAQTEKFILSEHTFWASYIKDASLSLAPTILKARMPGACWSDVQLTH